MSAILKLTPASQAFLTGLAASGNSSSMFVSIALARAIAYSLPLIVPDSTSEIGSSYRTAHRTKVETQLSLINEIVSLDTATVLSYTEKFYSHRVELAIPNTPVIALKAESVANDFFKISKYFDPNMLQVLADNAITITSMTNNFSQTIQQF